MRAICVKDKHRVKLATYCCSMMENTTDCAMTKQFGSACPSSPQIFASKRKKLFCLLYLNRNGKHENRKMKHV